MSSSSSTKAKADNMKSFYKQKKGNISKKSSTKSVSLGSSITQPSLLTSPHNKHDQCDDVKEEELALRQFDMNMAYGPCLGISRLDRYERAKKLGMNPPDDVENLLKLPRACPDCLWEGRV